MTATKAKNKSNIVPWINMPTEQDLWKHDRIFWDPILLCEQDFFCEICMNFTNDLNNELDRRSDNRIFFRIVGSMNLLKLNILYRQIFSMTFNSIIKFWVVKSEEFIWSRCEPSSGVQSKSSAPSVSHLKSSV